MSNMMIKNSNQNSLTTRVQRLAHKLISLPQQYYRNGTMMFLLRIWNIGSIDNSYKLLNNPPPNGGNALAVFVG